MKLRGAITRHVPGWSGGVLEGAEPDLAQPKGFGSLADGLNVQTAPLGRVAVRGGSRVLLTLAEDDVSDVLGVWPFSPTGAIAIAHDDTADTHYAYALTADVAFALGSPVTETDSRVALGTGWATADRGKPVCVELFETLYVVDATATNPRPMVALRVVAGVLTLVEPTYELNGGGADSAYPFCAAVYNSALFVAGWGDETDLSQPHTVRNSLIGTAPDDAAGFDPDGYAIIGAHGQRVQAMEPGREILLVAKASELYRIFGSGQALPGWHYGIQQLENTRGYGVSNPYALKHINQYWYGIGQSGPFRTDGNTVDPLGVPWRDSWQRMDRLDQAWVTYRPNPDSRKVWFGFYETGFTGYPEAPFTIWTWDIDRETWSPPARSAASRSFHLVNCLIPDTTEAPDGSPLSLAQRYDYGAFGFTSVEARWTAADADATTEIWTRSGTGAYTLAQTVDAGIQRVVLTVPPAATTMVKARHVKSGVNGPFTSPVTLYPRLPSPLLSFTSGYSSIGPVTATVYNPMDGAEITVEPANGAWTENETGLAVGSFAVDDILADACTVGYDHAVIEATLEHPDWPVGKNTSRTEELTTAQVGCVSNPAIQGPVVTQLIESGGMQPTSITVRYHPHATLPLGFRVDYKLATDSTWTVVGTIVPTPAPAPHTTQTVVITGLTAGKAYHVRCVNVQYEGTFPADAISPFDTCYTTLPTPTISAATVGSTGLPETEVTITPAIWGTGHQVVLYDAREDVTQTQAFTTSTPVVLSNTVATAPNRYYARHYHASWPEGFQYSAVATDDIVDPETVS